MPKRKDVIPKNKSQSRQEGSSAQGRDNEVIRPQMAVRLEFGRRFEAAMLAKGVRQIDVANATDIGRDSISGYTRGRVLPDADRLKKICNYLGTTPDMLVPHYGSSQKQVELMPAFSFQANAEGNGWLRINQTVSIDQMSQIAEILRKKK